MKILLVEDEESVGIEFVEELRDRCSTCSVFWARHRDEAVERLEAQSFDLVVCDLRIPPRSGSADLSENYGLEVHARLRAEHPGVPSYFLTGYADAVDLRTQLTLAPSADLFGTRELHPLVTLFYKDEFRECVTAIVAMATELERLAQIALVPEGIEAELGETGSQAIRIYASRNQGALVEVARLGGLSGQAALRATVRDATNQVRARVFAKVGNRARLLRELSAFEQNVPNLLPPGSYPPVVDKVDAGIRDEVCLLFGLAAGFENSDLFAVLAESGEKVVPLLQDVRELLTPWRDLRKFGRVGLEELSPTSISRAAVEEVIAPDMFKPEVWMWDFRMPLSPQHGDLHGENILLSSTGQPMLIDFALARVLPACLDPISLELSLLFHPKSPLKESEWPSRDRADAWLEVDEYVRGCPWPRVVKYLRAWALEDAGEESAFLAVALANVLRQFKYPDTDKEIAASIALAIASSLTLIREEDS
jgi:CheY-like chemotaxis protein